MSSFILLWNPSHFDFVEYQDLCDLSAEGRSVGFNWAVGGRKGGVSPGDRTYLFRVGEHRGVVASGIVQSQEDGTGIFWEEHWDVDQAATTPYVDVEWEAVLDTDEMLVDGVLEARIPAVSWAHLQSSGVRVKPPADEDLLALWLEHLEGRAGYEVTPLPEELEISELDGYPEGAARTLSVNRYERSPAARAAAVEAHGTTCRVCGFDFGETYGDIGDGFIHIHHTVELSSVGDDYEVDPATDLVPVCPNCHAMLHRRSPAFSPDELRELLAQRMGR